GRGGLDRGLDELVESFGVFDGDLREHLAVEHDARVLEAVHEQRVACTTHAASRGDTSDPQTTHVTLAGATVAPSERAGAGQRDLCLLEVPGLGPVVTTGFAENALVCTLAG